MKHFILLLAVLAVFCGCATLQTTVTGVADWRDLKTGGVCPVHHVAMRTEMVYEPHPDSCYFRHPAYAEARRTRFPYARDDYELTAKGSRRGKIYVCPSCLLARANQ